MTDTLFPLPEETCQEKVQTNNKVRLEKGDRYQARMIVASLNDLLPEDHRARIVWGMVEMMDLSKFYVRINAIEGEAGRPAIDPRMLIAVWLYATLEGVGKARELARLCEEHIAYRWLMGDIRVNYHSLADFRVDYEYELDELLTKGVAALMKEGIVKLERTAQDGMRVRASAGAGSFKKRSKLEENLEQARARIQHLKQQDKEDTTNTPQKQAAQERAAREREGRLMKALEELDKIEAKRAKSNKKSQRQKVSRSSSTDAEARFLKMPAGETRPGFNAELCIDTESRIIVGVDVIDTVDQSQMDPMLEELHARYGQYPDEHLVDGGFVTNSDMEAAYEKKVTVYAPLPKPRQKGLDPTKPLKRDGPGIREWRERMTTDAAKQIYKLRAATIEWANALSRNRGFQQMVVRGIHKVRSVLLWFALAHNLLQTQNLLTYAPSSLGGSAR